MLAVDLGHWPAYISPVQRKLLIIPFLLAFSSAGALGQQNAKAPLPVNPSGQGSAAQLPKPASAPVAPAAPAATPPGVSTPNNTFTGRPAPAPAPAAAAAAAGGSNAAPSEEMIPKMEFPNADVKEVLSFYERLTGSRIIYDNTVQGTVNIVISSPVTQHEAVQIIETNLLLNGYTLVPAPNNIIKVIGLSKNARSTGVPIYSDLDLLPETDRVVTFIFRLKFADPTELIPIIQAGYVAASPNYSTMTALPKSQSIMVTESTPVLRELAKLIQKIDVAPAEVVSEFIPLERADVKDVIEKLEKLLEKPQSQGGAGATVRSNPAAANPAGGAAAPGQEGVASLDITGGTGGGANLSEDSVIVGKIKLTADVRTNRIHVITRPVNLPFIRQIIQDFDSNVPFAEPAKRALKFVPAAEMLDILVKAISEPGVKVEEGAGGTGSKTGSKSTSSGGGSMGGLGNMGNMGSMSGGMGVMGGGGGSGMGGEELQAEPVDTTPKAVTVGNTKIIADPRENTIIVIGNKDVRAKLFGVIDQLDVRAPQVMLNTIIGELTVNEDSQFGVDYILHSGGLLTGGSNNGTTTTLLPGGGHAVGGSNFGSSSLVSSLAGALGGGPGLTAVLGLGNSLDVVVSALQSTGRFRVVQRPSVFANNNKKAIIASGESIAVPTQTLSNVNSNGILNNNTAAVSSSVQYLPVELKLEVVPLINSDREVTLDIVQTLNSDSGKSTNVGGSNIPTITTRYIKTNVSVPNRGTVILGGLIKRNKRMDVNGIPILGKLPGLGYLFRNTQKKNDREELVILIRPVVTRKPSETMFNSDTEQQRLMIEPDLESTLNNAGASDEEKPVKSIPFRTNAK
jgi:type II secretion system protein D